MTVVFDAEPLLAFSFDEPGAGTVERWLDRVYDGDVDGYIATINLAEFRYIAIRETSVAQADSHINTFRDMGLREVSIDSLWSVASELKAAYSPSIGDAYAAAAATTLDEEGQNVTLLVGADDDYDVFEDTEQFSHLIKRFRTDPV